MSAVFHGKCLFIMFDTGFSWCNVWLRWDWSFRGWLWSGELVSYHLYSLSDNCNMHFLSWSHLQYPFPWVVLLLPVQTVRLFFQIFNTLFHPQFGSANDVLMTSSPAFVCYHFFTECKHLTLYHSEHTVLYIPNQRSWPKYSNLHTFKM